MKDARGVSSKGTFFMSVLALQFGLQPVLQKACVDTHNVDRMSFIIIVELTKMLVCVSVILSGGPRSYRPILESWTLRGSLATAALPAAGYALQSWLSQLAYTNLDSLTFNLLNQTKTLFAALCLYLVMGKKQSYQQLFALSLLLGAALLLNAGDGSGGEHVTDDNDDGAIGAPGGTGGETDLFTSDVLEAEADFMRLWLGVLPVMLAALLSGFLGAVTQRTLQRDRRNASLLSLELAVYGVAVLLLTSGLGVDRLQPKAGAGGRSWLDGLFQGWTKLTWLPVLSQAAGGLVVGQVTKHAGSVKKGFALIGGIVLTAIVQNTLERSALTRVHWIAAVLVAGGTYLHSSRPVRFPKKAKKVL
ncbi:unnamed protein product [Hapterophycus canaliculatus]